MSDTLNDRDARSPPVHRLVDEHLERSAFIVGDMRELMADLASTLALVDAKFGDRCRARALAHVHEFRDFEEASTAIRDELERVTCSEVDEVTQMAWVWLFEKYRRSIQQHFDTRARTRDCAPAPPTPYRPFQPTGGSWM